jgi:hypothetical protein
MQDKNASEYDPIKKLCEHDDESGCIKEQNISCPDKCQISNTVPTQNISLSII